jgi:hypothetical protein
LQSNIIGTLTYYAGGGGGGGGGAGGLGGGGAPGAGIGEIGRAGNVNTGGGAGGSGAYTSSGNAGGSGIVILSYPTELYANATSTTGNPNVILSGGNIIYRFWQSGSITF